MSVRRPETIQTAAIPAGEGTSVVTSEGCTKIEVPIDYLGFTIEDKFVIGYGLDWAQRYRNLPFIGVVEHT